MFWLDGTYINREKRDNNVQFHYLFIGNVGHTKGLSGNKMSPDSFAIQVPELLKAQMLYILPLRCTLLRLFGGIYTACSKKY